MVRRVLLVFTSLLWAAGLIACADNGAAPKLPGNAGTSGYDGVISGAPTADAATIAASAWATAVKQRGVPVQTYLIVAAIYVVANLLLSRLATYLEGRRGTRARGRVAGTQAQPQQAMV
jgi:hypothetical protein